MKFWIKTLGCKVNQVESAFMQEQLLERGLEPAESEEFADVLVLNSCAVTEKAYQESKKIIQTWQKKHPRLIVLTGCSAVIYREYFERLAERQGASKILILNQDQKYELVKFLSLNGKSFVGVEDTWVNNESCQPMILKNFWSHSRAFVKIQDGCSSRCSYCIVPLARGPSRSLPEELILTQISLFLEKGYEEIVLTGIHLGKWGEDLNPKRKLTDLLWKIEEIMEKYRKPLNLRLSSLEIKEIDEDFFTYAKVSKFLCPHFHLPLQSGSDVILKNMNRNYRAKDYMETLMRFYCEFPLATLGADVIVGFPGEGKKEFWETYELIEKSPLNWLHIFSFSPRPGTPAERLAPRVSQREIKERVKILKELFTKKRDSFLRKNINTVRKAILEEEKKDFIKGLTDNYISFYIPKKELPSFKKGQLLKVRLLEFRDGFILAKPEEDEKVMKAGGSGKEEGCS
ncbi:MAG: tRNA (N(6)-L-threonylcarbamoyladenosine(37)-C(2))-methylthiotransferase MtaB [Caldimicrobium sp.]|nr:tRNA (N(6)-L-threonylcarbamoyladenosine(37)-C(2))-methylthiotransferase MtaB [Caldimicrobium sp.]MDW8094437.1 tRNA (N(6)-L-threonylcarbamoyladenosine(37)-C(2))-methylthiotransferase MtaB [Caldimicrobium sp.]